MLIMIIQNTKTQEDKKFVMWNGERIDVEPKP